MVRSVRVLEPASLSLLTDRRHAPDGADGGDPGDPGCNFLNDEELPAKASRRLEPGDVVTLRNFEIGLPKACVAHVESS